MRSEHGLFCQPVQAALDRADGDGVRPRALNEPAHVHRFVARNRSQLDRLRSAQLFPRPPEEGFRRVHAQQHLDAVPLQRHHIGRRDFVLHVDRRARGDQVLVLHDCRDLVQVRAERLDVHRLHADRGHLVRVVEREGHVAVAFLLQQKRGRLPAPVLPVAADFDLAVQRVVDFLPGQQPFAQQQVLVERLDPCHPPAGSGGSS